MDKESQEDLLRDKFHQAVEKECSPVIERIASQIYIGKSPDELGQILLKDGLVGGIYSGYVARKTFKKIKGILTKGK